MHLFDAATGARRAEVARGPGYQQGDFAVTPDGTIVTVAKGDAVVLFDAATAAVRKTLKAAPGVHARAGSGDGKRLAGVAERCVLLWAPADEEPRALRGFVGYNSGPLRWRADGAAVTGRDTAGWVVT